MGVASVFFQSVVTLIHHNVNLTLQTTDLFLKSLPLIALISSVPQRKKTKKKTGAIISHYLFFVLFFLIVSTLCESRVTVDLPISLPSSKFKHDIMLAAQCAFQVNDFPDEKCRCGSVRLKGWGG